MRYSPNAATDLVRLQEQEFHGAAERARTQAIGPAQRFGLVGRTAVVLVLLAPIAVLVSSLAG